MRYAEFTSDGLLNVIGGDSDKIIAEEFPYLHNNIIAAARIVLDRNDCEREHNFRCAIIDVETSEVVAEGVSGTIPPFALPPNAHFLGTGLLLRFPAPIFPRAGGYALQVVIDDAVMATARIRVAPLAYYQTLAATQPATEVDAHGPSESNPDQ